MSSSIYVAQNLEELLEFQGDIDTPECSECGRLMNKDAFPAIFSDDEDGKLENVWCEHCSKATILAFTRLKFRLVG